MTRDSSAPKPDRGHRDYVPVDHALPVRIAGPASLLHLPPHVVPPKPPRRPRTRAEARAHLALAAQAEGMWRDNRDLTWVAIAQRLHLDARTIRRYREYAEWVEVHAEERAWIDGKRDR